MNSISLVGVNLVHLFQADNAMTLASLHDHLHDVVVPAKLQRQKRKMFAKEWFELRSQLGAFMNLVERLLRQYEMDQQGIIHGYFEPYNGYSDFVAFFRISPNMMNELYARVGDLMNQAIAKHHGISNYEKIAVTIYYLGHQGEI